MSLAVSKPPDKTLSGTALRRMEFARQANEYARKQIPHAGNQKHDIVETDAESSARGAVARSLLKTIQGKQSHEEPDARTANSAETAAAAIGAHGGMCNEYAALTHQYLSEHALHEPVVRMWDDNWHHAFTVLGDPRIQDSVLADPWVPFNEPMLFDQSLWSGNSRGVFDVQSQTSSQHDADRQHAAYEEAAAKIPKDRILPLYDASDAKFKRAPGIAGRRAFTNESDADYLARTLTWNGMFDYPSARRPAPMATPSLSAMMSSPILPSDSSALSSGYASTSGWNPFSLFRSLFRHAPASVLPSVPRPAPTTDTNAAPSNPDHVAININLPDDDT